MVANPERGEVGLTVTRGDETREYILKLTTNAAVMMQKRLKKPLAQIVADLERLDMESVRDLAFMFLQKYHKDEFKTVEQAGDLVDDAGGLGPFFQAFKQLIAANDPGESAAGNPQTAQPKTTGDSTSLPVGTD